MPWNCLGNTGLNTRQRVNNYSQGEDSAQESSLFFFTITIKIMQKGTKIKKWTQAEEDVLIANIKKSPTNLRKAFKQTSLEIQRSEKAITAHWYTKTSKDNTHVLFLTVSGKHVAFNRKNGKGQKSSLPLYKKILAFFGVSY